MMMKLDQYKTSPAEQELIDRIPALIDQKDPKMILDALIAMHNAPENEALATALLIIEKFIFRTYEVLFFLADSGREFDFERYYADEDYHLETIKAVLAEKNAADARLEYQKGVLMIRQQLNDFSGMFFKAAALGGDADGAYNYGVTLSRGEGCEPDPMQGCFWYWFAACRGNLKGMFNLAVNYHDGEGVCKDAMCMLYWYSHAALKGNPDAAMRVARALLLEGVMPGLEIIGKQMILAAQAQDSELLHKYIRALLDPMGQFMYNKKIELE